jgi:transcriptional regulator with XRE-family HTH domain
MWDNPMDLLQKMEKRRRELGMSRSALAKRSHVSLPTINRIMSKKRDRASLASVLAIAGALGMELTADARVESSEFCRQLAQNLAKRLVTSVQGTCGLEGQGLDQRDLERLVSETTERLLRSKRRLWWE